MAEVNVRFSRTIRPAEYESKTAEAWVTEEVPAEHAEAWMERQFDALKATVYSQLGVPFHIDDTTGQVVEDEVVKTVQEAFPGSQVVTGTNVVPMPAQPQAPVPTAVPQGPAPNFCEKCQSTEIWDNRPDNNRKRAGGYKLGPDFKCKQCGHAWWPDDFQQFKHLPREPR